MQTAKITIFVMFNDTAISANQMQIDDIISNVLPSFLGTPFNNSNAVIASRSSQYFKKNHRDISSFSTGYISTGYVIYLDKKLK